jgi:hypothetical protein
LVITAFSLRLMKIKLSSIASGIAKMPINKNEAQNDRHTSSDP